MLDLLKAVLFGIVQGITEWLPISSTGHLILIEQFISFEQVSPGFWSMFEVVIQFGSILAVVVLFWPKLWPFGSRFSKVRHPMQESGFLSHVKKDTMQLWCKILVACVPAGIVGVFFGDAVEALFYKYYFVAMALIVFGVAFILVENHNRDRSYVTTALSAVTYQEAVLIGVFQVIAAVFPGTSRSGATIVGALLLGISRTVAAEFTFFLAVPVMLGASLLKLVKFGAVFTGLEVGVLSVGCLVAFLISMLVIRFLLQYIRRHDFKVFGWYRICLGIIVLLYFMLAGRTLPAT